MFDGGCWHIRPILKKGNINPKDFWGQQSPPTHPFVDNPERPEVAADEAGPDDLGVLHGQLPQLLLGGAAVRGQGPGGVWAAQELCQDFHCLFVGRQEAIAPEESGWSGSRQAMESGK